MASYQITRSSTAYPLVFLMVDTADHLTGKTGLTPTVTLSKAGGSFASPAGAVSEIGNGWYKVAGNATDSGTLGPLLLHATASGADPTDELFEVVAHDVQNSTTLGLTNLGPAVIRTGTAQAGSLAGITLDSGASSTSNLYRGCLLVLTGGAGAGQCRTIVDNDGTTKVANLDFAWATQPDSTTTFAILPRSGPKSYTSGLEAAVGSAVSVEFINDDVISSTVLTADAKQSIAAYVRTELTTELARIDAAISTRLASASYTAPLDAAGTRTAVGLGSANLDTQLAAIAWHIDTEVASILSSVGSLPTAAQIADKVLGRNIAGGSDGGRTVTEALRLNRNRWTRTATTLTVYAEDDTTESWTSTFTTDSTLDPVSESNP